VEWLGRVPEHWAVMRFRDICEGISTGPFGTALGNGDYVTGGVPVINPSHIVAEQCCPDEDISVSAETAERLRFWAMQAGDIVTARRGELGRSALITAEQDGWICGTGSLRVRPMPDRVNARHLHTILQSNYARDWLNLSSVGSTMANLNESILGQLPVACPGIAEQAAIAAHLDRETARIDALVEKKTRFIELLREKRQALSTHAVTKGLDPNVKMKDSGVEWLGKVPEHWVTRRVAALFREVIRPGVQDLPVLSISIHSGISDDELSADERDRKVSLIEDREKYKRVRPGDLAYNMMRAWQGAFGAVTVDGLVSPAYVVAEPKMEISTAYIELLLRTPMAIEEMRKCSRGITDFRMRMYWEAFREVLLLLPPYEEQIAIVNMVMQEAERIDALAGKTEHSITLLKERRSALITAAVTGQIDLREAV
jgi:type I restriction enzyme S subunit